ncbi:ParB/RepB/Spo0J family partition protein (plasmid) [Streptomyces sp. NBC_01267]|uniref:ParB/RepB/Spo0J family partition protein n=1 Tax=Streptomyces sp. NBC_01267 TaxID=2903805 RepID=UPI002E3462F2|nr:ParB/RepB/Spo0J family partition protein [Streptomyces sp. NBC_01267]
MGRRVNLATIDDKPVAVAADTSAGVPLALLVANPRNPREDLGDLEDLKSIAKRQLQPCLVVTSKGYLALWPEDAERVGHAQYVVVNGCRRLAAAHKFGRAELLIVHDETVAVSRGELLGAAVEENIGRQDFDIIEEARAVEAVVAEYPSTREAAKARGWTHGWVSQRRALLKLTPEMQGMLRAGDLAVRDARRLARVPAADQVSTWRAEQDAAEQRKKEQAEQRKQQPPQQRRQLKQPESVDPVVTAVTTPEGGGDPETDTASVGPSVVTAVTTDGEAGSGIPEPRNDSTSSATALPTVTVEWTNPQVVADLCTANMTHADLEAMLDILTSRL